MSRSTSGAWGVRVFRSGDADAVTRLWAADRAASVSPWNDPAEVIGRKLHVQPDLFLVASADRGGVVGTVVAGYDGVRGWVHRLHVDRAWRRRGVGTALMRAAEDRLAGLGCPKVNLQVRRGDAGVTAFYESLGYSVEDRVSMGRPLGTKEEAPPR